MAQALEVCAVDAGAGLDLNSGELAQAIFQHEINLDVGLGAVVPERQAALGEGQMLQQLAGDIGFDYPVIQGEVTTFQFVGDCLGKGALAGLTGAIDQNDGRVGQYARSVGRCGVGAWREFIMKIVH